MSQFHVYLPWFTTGIGIGTFNQEKVLVGALICDCNRVIFAKVRLQLYSLLFVPRLEHRSATRGAAKLCCMLREARCGWAGLVRGASHVATVANECHQEMYYSTILYY